MLAQKYALGLELDHFCTAANMDCDFERWDKAVRADMRYASHFVLHAPFAELTPCAIDPMIREVSLKRLRQAAKLCAYYGIHRMVVHSGFQPKVYFPEWYVDQAPTFFRELLRDLPSDFELLIENVLDPQPELLLNTVRAIDDPRARICLDVGHAFTASQEPPLHWIEVLSPVLSHLHLHDNDGSWDFHMPPGDGKIGFPALFDTLDARVPDATWTFECPDAAGCIRNLRSFGIL